MYIYTLIQPGGRCFVQCLLPNSRNPHDPGAVGASPGEANWTSLRAAVKAVCAGWGRSAGLQGAELLAYNACAPALHFLYSFCAEAISSRKCFYQ